MDPFEIAFMGNVVLFYVDARRLEKWRDDSFMWCSFQDDFLKYVSAARNTPSLPDQNDQQEWWILKITLRGAKETFDYIHEFSASTDAALKDQLPPDSTFSKVYQIVRQGSDIALHIAPLKGSLATKDYKTKLSTNRGLLSASSPGMEGICYHLYRKAHMNANIMPRPAELQQPLTVGDPLCLSEDARLQFKGLVVGYTTCTNKTKAKGRIKRFRPRTARNYVEWIWGWYDEGLGDYISAFTKNPEGGAIYYGVNQNPSGYKVGGLRLPTSWKDEIEWGICEKVCSSMLWVGRDPSATNGYKILAPEDINYFTVNCIPVRSLEDRQSYILEVRVAPFNGIVFNDPQGPEAYVMRKIPGGTFRPVRLSKDEWLAKMRDYEWCSTHNCSKERQCVQCAV